MFGKSSALTSSQANRASLWNVQDPNDPYDIRKSMIASIPGGHVALGSNLEVLCLLQAAEIERLVDFLEIFKFKFKDLERNELDRHSYEVQIKELMARLTESEQLRKDNEKLTQFVNKQGQQISSLREDYRQDFQKAFQEAADRNRLLLTQNEGLRRTHLDFQNQIATLRAALEASQADKQKQVERASAQAAAAAGTQADIEARLQAYRLQYAVQLQKMEIQIKLLQKVVEQKNEEILRIREENRALEQHNSAIEREQRILRQSERRSEETAGQQFEALRSQYEKRNGLLSANLEQTISTLEQEKIRAQGLERKLFEQQRLLQEKDHLLRDQNIRLRAKEEEVRSIAGTLGQRQAPGIESSEQIVLKQETQLREMSITIESLNVRLKNQTENGRLAREENNRRIVEYNSRVEQLMLDNDKLRRSVVENNEIRRQLAQTQTEKAIALQEVERLSQVLRAKDSESHQLQVAITENSDLKARLHEVEQTWAYRHDSELNKVRQDFEVRMSNLIQVQGSEVQSRLVAAERELEREKQLLRMRTDEAERLRATGFEWQAKYSKLELDQGFKTKNYEAALSTLKKENAELYNKLRDHNELELRTGQLQNKLALLEGEHQQLKSLMRNREEENQHLALRLREIEAVSSQNNLESSRRVSEQIQSINSLKNENESLKRRLNELLATNETLNKETVSQINRLNGLIRTLQEEKGRLEYGHRKLGQDLEYQVKAIAQLTQEKEDFMRSSLELDVNLKNLSSDAQSRLRALQIQNEHLKKQNIDIKSSLSNYEAEIARRGNSYEQNLFAVTKENEEIRRQLREAEARLTQASVDLDTINSRFKTKCDELVLAENSLRASLSEIEQTRRQFKDYEVNVANRFEGEVSRKYSNYEQTIQTLKQELEEARRRTVDAEARHQRLNTELDRVSLALRNAGLEIDSLKQINQEREAARASFHAEINQKIGHYEHSIQTMTRNHQELEKKILQNGIDLRQKYEENTQLEARYRQACRERDELKRQCVEAGSRLKEKVGELSGLAVLAKENEHLKKRIEKYDISIAAYEGEVNKKFAEMDQSIEMLGRDNQELRTKLNDLNEASRRIGREADDRTANLSRELERALAHIASTETDNSQLRKALQQAEANNRNRASELENKLALISQQVERLNLSLKSKTEQTLRLVNENRNIQVDLESTRRQNQLVQSKYTFTLENEVTQRYNNYQRTIAELKNQLAQAQNNQQRLIQELERTANELKTRSGESGELLGRYNSLSGENDTLRKKMRETEATLNQTILITRSENEELRRRHQQALRQLSQDYEGKMAEFEHRTKIMIQEIERLNQAIAKKNQELERTNKGIKEYEISLQQKAELDVRTRTQIENALSTLQRQNQELKQRMQQLTEVNRKIPELEHRLVVLTEENSQIQAVVRSKTEEIVAKDIRLRQQLQSLRRQSIQNQQEVVSQIQSEAIRKIANIQQNFSALSREREDLRRRTADYELQINNLMIEIQRLNLLVRTKSEELQRTASESELLRVTSVSRLQNSESELAKTQANYQKVRADYDAAKNNLIQYEVQLKQIHGEFEKFQKMIEELQRERQDLYQKNLFLSDQIQRLTQENQDLETQTKDIRLRLSDESSLQKRIHEQLSLMVVLFAEIESLRKRVLDKEKEVEKVRRSSLSPHILRQ